MIDETLTQWNADTAKAAMKKAVLNLVASQPFFGSLLLRLKVEASTTHKTTATDGVTLFYNPSFVASLSERELVGMIAHEALHIAAQHTLRRQTRDQRLWNRACDLAVNPELLRAGFKLPDGHLLEARFGGWPVEMIYNELLMEEENARRQQQQQQRQQQASLSSSQSDAGDGDESEDESEDEGDDELNGDNNAPSDGNEDGDEKDDAASDKQGDGDQDDGEKDNESDDDDEAEAEAEDAKNDGDGEQETKPDPKPQKRGYEPGDVLDHPDVGTSSEANAAQEAKVAVAQALATAAASGVGDVAAGLRRMFEEDKEPLESCADLIRRVINDRNVVDYSWARPNRRFTSQGLYLPGYENDGVDHVCVIVDTSGSIDHAALSRFAGIVREIFEDGHIAKMTVLCNDLKVQSRHEFFKGDAVDLVADGGGGTSFVRVMQTLSDEAPGASLVLVLSDMLCDAWGEDPGVKVIWVAYGHLSMLQSGAHGMYQLATGRVSRWAPPPYGEIVPLQM